MDIADSLLRLASPAVAEKALCKSGEIASKRIIGDRPATAAIVSASGSKQGSLSLYVGAVASARELAFKCWGWNLDALDQPSPKCTLRRLIRTASSLLHIAAASGEYSLAADAASALIMRALADDASLAKPSPVLMEQLRGGAASLVAAITDFVDPLRGTSQAHNDERPPLERAQAKVAAEAGGTLIGVAEVVFRCLKRASGKILSTKAVNGEAAGNPAPELGASPADTFLGAGAAFAPDGTAECSDATSRVVIAAKSFLRRAVIAACADGDASDAKLANGISSCARLLDDLCVCISLSVQAGAALARASSSRVSTAAAARAAAAAHKPRRGAPVRGPADGYGSMAQQLARAPSVTASTTALVTQSAHEFTLRGQKRAQRSLALLLAETRSIAAKVSDAGVRLAASTGGGDWGSRTPSAAAAASGGAADTAAAAADGSAESGIDESITSLKQAGIAADKVALETLPFMSVVAVMDIEAEPAPELRTSAEESSQGRGTGASGAAAASARGGSSAPESLNAERLESLADSTSLLSVAAAASHGLRPGRAVSRAVSTIVAAIPDYISALPDSRVDEAVFKATGILGIACFRRLVGDDVIASVPAPTMASAEATKRVLDITASGHGLAFDHMDPSPTPSGSQITSSAFRTAALEAWGKLVNREDVIGRCSGPTADYSISQLLFFTRSMLDRLQTALHRGVVIPEEVLTGMFDLATSSLVLLCNVLGSSPSAVARDAISNSTQLEYTIFSCLSASHAPLLNVAAVLLLHQCVFYSFQEWTTSPTVPIVRQGGLLRSCRILHTLAGLRQAQHILSCSKTLRERYGDAIPAAEASRVNYNRMGIIDGLLSAAFGSRGPALSEMIVAGPRGQLIASSRNFAVTLPKPGMPPSDPSVPVGVDVGMRALAGAPEIGDFLSLGFCRGIVTGFVFRKNVLHVVVQPDVSSAMVARDAVIETLSVASIERERRRAYATAHQAAARGQGPVPPPFASFAPAFGTMRPATGDDPGFTPFRPVGVAIMPADEAEARGLVEGWRMNVSDLCSEAQMAGISGAASSVKVLRGVEHEGELANTLSPGFMVARARVHGSEGECGGRAQPLQAVMPPVGFEPIGFLADSLPQLLLWRPLAPPGYAALGMAVSEAGRDQGPSLDACWCVHASLVETAPDASVLLPCLTISPIPRGFLSARAVASARAPPWAVAAAEACAADGGAPMPFPRDLAMSATLTVGQLACASAAAVASPVRGDLQRLRVAAVRIPSAAPDAVSPELSEATVVNQCLASCLQTAIRPPADAPVAARRTALKAAAYILSRARQSCEARVLERVFGGGVFEVACDALDTAIVGCALKPKTSLAAVDSSVRSVLEQHPHDTVLQSYLLAEVGPKIWRGAVKPTRAEAEAMSKLCAHIATRHSAGDDRTFVCAVITLAKLAETEPALSPSTRQIAAILLSRLAKQRDRLADALSVAPTNVIDALFDSATVKDRALEPPPEGGGCCEVM